MTARRRRLREVCLSVAALGATSSQAQSAPPTVAVYAAGSLRAALTDVARAFEHDHPAQVTMTFGASGLLKDRIVAGESPQVFASANMEHPEALVAAGRAAAVSAFARNALSVLATPAFSLRGKTLTLRLLDAQAHVGVAGRHRRRNRQVRVLDARRVAVDGRRVQLRLLEQVVQQQPRAGAGLTVDEAHRGLPAGATSAQVCQDRRGGVRAVHQALAPPMAADQLVRSGFEQRPQGAVEHRCGPRQPWHMTRLTQQQMVSSNTGSESNHSTVYEGVLLREVLSQAGFGAATDRGARVGVVEAVATDGYRSVFSWGELFNSTAGEHALIITTQDGRTLNTAAGPLALRALADLRPGPRHVRNLCALVVRR